MKSFKSFVVEAMDREYRREFARERRTEREAQEKHVKSGIGAKKKGPKLSTTKRSASAGKDYANSQMSSIALHDKASKKRGHTTGNPFPEEYQYEECGCEHEEDEKEETKKVKRRPMGGSAAKPGPNNNYVKPMGESTIVHKMGGVVMGKTRTDDGKDTVQVDDAPVSKSTHDFMKKKGMTKVDSSGKPTSDTDYAERKAAGLKTVKKVDEAAGEKDACYKKVKSKYDVWPSAYASGALVKCRKVGAANWGNKKKK